MSVLQPSFCLKLIVNDLGMTLSVPFFLLVSESLSDCKPPKELLRCNKKALCEKIVFNNHENQVKTSSFALKTILKKVAEKWLFLTKKVADFRVDHLETLVTGFAACCSVEANAKQSKLEINKDQEQVVPKQDKANFWLVSIF